jgi:4-hydroxybenzoate polyprenyltransferase/phosphoserine phosphatase
MKGRPIAVDLDGTLFVDDSAWENLRFIILRNPTKVPALLIQAFFGRASLKDWLHREAGANRNPPAIRQELLARLLSEKKKGRAVHLVSGAPQDLVEVTAKRLGFNLRLKHWGSSTQSNLTFSKKELLVKTFGVRGYDYYGDRKIDIPIFKNAERGAIVGARPAVVQRALRVNPRLETMAPKPAFASAAFRALRPHQWVKNLLLLVPLFSAHIWGEVENWILAGQAFVAFSLLSSAVYLLNDLYDLDSDRAHPQKKMRPLACRELKYSEALMLIIVLLASAFGLAFFLGQEFLFIAFTYFALAVFYNVWGKRKAGLDLIMLASFYTLRILAGGAAVEIICSPWLLGFAIFIFLSLACIKRVSELLRLKADEQLWAKGRGYGIGDMEAIAGIGIASGVVSILVAALYVNSPDVSVLYSRPQSLWFLCPLLFYWIIRVWLKTLRKEMEEDPVLFAIKDRASWGVLLLAMLTVYIASR